MLAWAQLINAFVGAVFNVVGTLGEELCWRGLLFGWLRDRLGAAWAVVALGIIWGLWHAPLVLLGYNYPGHAPGLALVAMCGFTTVLTPVLAWLRERSGSIWPAALGHGMVNAAAGFGVVFGMAGRPIDNLHAGLLGWSGWLPAIALGVVLLVTTGLRRWTPPPPVPRQDAAVSPLRNRR